MKKIITILLLGFALAKNCTAPSTPQACSVGWKITGYYVPFESDYTGKKIPVQVGGVTYQLKEDFVSAVRMEGDGKTMEGWILNCCPFARATKVIGSCNKELRELEAVARDAQMMKCDTSVTIKTPILSGKVFKALDTGGAIKGKHLDVFCGFGKQGKDLSYKITTSNAEVCY